MIIHITVNFMKSFSLDIIGSRTSTILVYISSLFGWLLLCIWKWTPNTHTESEVVMIYTRGNDPIVWVVEM